MRPKLFLIAPNEMIAKVALEVIKEKEFNCDVVIGNLKNHGVKLAQDAQKHGAEAIISRGGTFLRIQQEILDLPLVPINVSTMDLLEALHSASYLSYKIGVVGYPNTIYEASSLGKFLKLDILEIPIDDQSALKERLKAEVDKGLEVIVGDTISTEVASDLGIQRILISSGKKAVYQAMEKAEELALLRRKEAISQQRVYAILNKVTEGILATDSAKRITHCNPPVEKYLGLSSCEILGNNIRDILPGRYQNDELVILKDQQYLLNFQQIEDHGDEDGQIFTLRPVKLIQDIETNLRKKLHSRGLVAKHTFSNIIGKSEEICTCIEKAKKISRSNATVLIIGKTGVGKEIFAQSIHNESLRANGPFVAVNCASFPESILESELFGYVEGSFTDARKGGKAGLFELAHRGTIFLDEIGEMSSAVQAKVLRVIQEKEVMHLGGDRVIPVDIRVIAATNFSLWDAVNEGRFRQDLYYRINVLKLEIPPLAERGQDVVLLAKELLRRLAPDVKIEENVFEALLEYDWPGNVRELYNSIEQIAVLYEGEILTKESVRDLLFPEGKPKKINLGSNPSKYPRRFKDDEILEALQRCNGNQTNACEILGINRSTLWRRLKKMGI